MRTVYDHIAQQITKVIKTEIGVNILISGGGAHNRFLIELLKKYINIDLILPDRKLIDFKEALIFAFLGVLKLRGENNCLSSVTGASNDCSGGILIMP
jgi:anhydro-N-acetylmuramic acid kinase